MIISFPLFADTATDLAISIEYLDGAIGLMQTSIVLGCRIYPMIICFNLIKLIISAV